MALFCGLSSPLAFAVPSFARETPKESLFVRSNDCESLTCDYSPISQPLDLVAKLSVKTNKADKQDGRYVIGGSNETEILAGQLKPFLECGKIDSGDATHCHA